MINRGNVKYWVKDGVLANVIGWGGHYCCNRPGIPWCDKNYDLRLIGKQRLEYYIIPFGDFDGNLITKECANLVNPVFLHKGKGNRSFYQIDNTNFCPTSVFPKDLTIHYRGYNLPDGKSQENDWEILNKGL